MLPFGKGARPPGAQVAVIATFVAHGMLFASWTAHIPHVEAQLGLSDATLGVLLLLPPIGAVAAMALTGRALPSLGSRRLVCVCLVAYCLAGPLVGMAALPLLLAAALLIWGAFQGALDVSMNTQALSLQRTQGRHLMSAFHGTWSIGAFCGAAIGTAAVALDVSLTAQLLVLAIPTLAIFGIFASRMVDDLPAAGRGSGPRRRMSRETLGLGTIAFATMLCEGACANWSAVYLGGPAHLDPAIAGLGLAGFALSMASIRLAGGRLLSRFRAHRLLPILAGLATVAMAVALATADAPAGLIGFAALGAGTALVVPTVFTIAGERAGVATSVGLAAVSSFGWAGFVCGPPLIGGLAGLVGLRGALVVIPTLTALITVATSRVGRSLPRDTAGNTGPRRRRGSAECTTSVAQPSPSSADRPRIHESRR